MLRPILFSGPMVKAILEGRKTMTRRIIKPQPVREMGTMGPEWWWKHHGGYSELHDDQRDFFKKMIQECPYGQPGDTLWVREKFTLESNQEFGSEDSPPPKDRPVKTEEMPGEGGKYHIWPHYATTDPEPELSCDEDNCRQCENGGGPHWKPSIFMPQWASRISLLIKDVRVERIKDIHQRDSAKEGFPVGIRPFSKEGPPKQRFIETWEKINPGSWARNDFVWAIEFEEVK